MIPIEVTTLTTLTTIIYKVLIYHRVLYGNRVVSVVSVVREANLLILMCKQLATPTEVGCFEWLSC